MAKSKSKPNRRQCLLDADKQLTAASEFILAFNAANSPLLKLPRELRDRIYELVLCHNHLHVPLKSPTAVTVCAVPSKTCFSEVRETVCREDGYIFVRKFEHPCKAGSKYSLSLLGVNSQIYQETALLPFEKNTFIVDAGVLRSFILSLLPTQRKAVRNLEIRNERWEWYIPNMVHGSLTKQLVGLRNLKISIAKSQHAAKWMEPILERLCNGRIESLKVTCASLTPPIPRIIGDWDEFDDWAKEMEVKLSSKTSWAEQKEEVVARRAEFRARKALQASDKAVQASEASEAVRKRLGMRLAGEGRKKARVRME